MGGRPSAASERVTTLAAPLWARASYGVHVQIGGRDVGKVAKAIFERRHYHAALKMMRLYEQPAQMFRRYLTEAGDYPYIAQVKAPSGWLNLQLFTPHDVLTVNKIFCREDYFADEMTRSSSTSVELGISAAYFCRPECAPPVRATAGKRRSAAVEPRLRSATATRSSRWPSARKMAKWNSAGSQRADTAESARRPVRRLS